MENKKQAQQFKLDNNELTKLPTLEALQSQLSAMVIRTTAQAIQSKTPSVGKLKAMYGDVKAKAVLVDLIVGFVEFVNVGKTFNGSQVAQTVQMMQQYFPHFNLADLKLFFDKMKLGHYGSLYDRMDGQLILEKMEEYNQQRMDEFELANAGEHKRIRKEEQENQVWHPTVIEALKKAVGDKKVLKGDIKHPRTKTEAEKFHQRVFKQFDNLYVRYGQNIGVRALKIGNTMLTIDAFIERKINNAINKPKNY